MAKGSYVRRAVIFLASAAILTGIDQWTKYMARVFLMGEAPFVLADGILEFLYVENKGAAFGILYGRQLIFVVLAIAVSVVLFLYFLRMPGSRRLLPFQGILICVTAGATGNCIDRLRLGYVVDFIYFMPIDFPVFNFADILVTCSAFLMIFLFIFVYDDEDLKELPIIGSGAGRPGHGLEEEPEQRSGPGPEERPGPEQGSGLGELPEPAAVLEMEQEPGPDKEPDPERRPCPEPEEEPVRHFGPGQEKKPRPEPERGQQQG